MPGLTFQLLLIQIVILVLMGLFAVHDAYNLLKHGEFRNHEMIVLFTFLLVFVSLISNMLPGGVP